MGQGRENSEIYFVQQVTGKPYLTFNKCIIKFYSGSSFTKYGESFFSL